MPYAPGNTDRSGELLAAGIGGAGNAITQAIKDAKRMKDEDALLRSHLNDAVTSGALPSETGAELVKEFMAGNHRKKMEIGLSAQLATKRHGANRDPGEAAGKRNHRDDPGPGARLSLV